LQNKKAATRARRRLSTLTALPLDENWRLELRSLQSVCRTVGRAFGSTAQVLLKPVEQLDLSGVDLLSRFVRREEGRAVDFGECTSLARAWRPFHCESVAAQGSGVAVGFEDPRVDQLAAFLPDCAERDEWAGRFEAGFLLEFANRGGQRIFAGGDLAFGNRPRAGVFLGPVRPAGVNKENLRLSMAGCGTSAIQRWA
jgi:hypothetical protein